MTFTPVVRWRNFTVQNLSYLLKLYPKWHGSITKDTLVNFMNNRLSSYGRTAYQFATQLGLENRQNEHDIKINNYLDYTNQTQMKNYLIFWLKTYYGPNPHVQGSNQPFIIYKQLAEDLISSSTSSILFSDFLNNHDIDSGSNDILLNALEAWGDPIKFRSSSAGKEAYIPPGDKTRLIYEIEQINKLFPIPKDYMNKSLFFERYSEKNFKLFKRIFLVGPIDCPHNRLLNGAPGTGKSYKLQKDCEKYLGTDYESYMERVTFHFTYSYQQFVGTYKPTTNDSGDSITYRYTPGPFLRLLVRAIRDYEDKHKFSANYILVIEELNRAKNPDAVFGDIFQLLDRNSDGLSKYTITCSEELLSYLRSEGLGHLTSLYLPPNFYIWATMNNADQGVQAIDSAFYRRWKPEYIDINNGESEIEDIEVEIKGYGTCNWNNFRKELNRRLLELGVKEDKLIGTFFIDLNSLGSNFEEVFVNKLLRYLFEDVMKFNRTQLFGENKHFYEVVAKYNADNIVLTNLDTSKFLI